MFDAAITVVIFNEADAPRARSVNQFSLHSSPSPSPALLKSRYSRLVKSSKITACLSTPRGHDVSGVLLDDCTLPLSPKGLRGQIGFEQKRSRVPGGIDLSSIFRACLGE
jgi:hypothetical protein